MKNFDKAYHGVARGFFYMPYMHCEDLEAQNTCCDIFRQIGESERLLLRAGPYGCDPALWPLPAPKQNPRTRHHARGRSI
jgi:hypothetical protein